ncbi:hypothetical protein HWV62_31277 [Athelia sp. TMB]|nr:hypothetical protein HWV62_31277 [Athelia sp. TMB]
MPNLLVVPFKQSYKAPVKQALRDYIHSSTTLHPDAFKWDIDTWDILREESRGTVPHVDQIDKMISYHAQLVFILTKLPTDIKLEIAYAPAFSSTNTIPVTLQNLSFERAAVLFNLGALYSQLASTEDRSSQEGIKKATKYYQQSAGTFNYLRTTALSKLDTPQDEENIPRDLTNSFIESIELSMVAQAQECAWQKAAVMDHFKNLLVAKLAMKVSSLYRDSAEIIKQASPPIKHLFPSDWLAHLETKQYHFAAVAQFRKSIDEGESNNYGVELARLTAATSEAKKGYDIARRGNVAPAVLKDIEALLKKAQADMIRAERDNDLIYHKDVPSPSALAAILEVAVAPIIVPPGLQNPQSAIGNDGVILGEMPGWGAGEAINIYNDHKQEIMRERIVDAAQMLNDDVSDTLRQLNLPASIDALERPIGLPPSLLQKAEEVRLEDGPERIDEAIENVERLAEHNSRLLDEALDILDGEASEDEAARTTEPLKRQPSHVANRDLTSKAARYRKILNEAQASDELVRRKWDDAETGIRTLCWSEADLEAVVPSSTIAASGSSNAGAETTRKHARAIRVMLETLEEFVAERNHFVMRAQRVSEQDYIRPRILRKAAGFELWADVTPAMFDDISTEELGKYDKFIQGIEVGRDKQAKLLEDIKAQNKVFLQSRKEDPSIKDREQALQALDQAYHQYQEITRNLSEGLQFYNDLAGILAQFKEACKAWSIQRSRELGSSSTPLSRSLQTMSLGAQVPDEDDAPAKPAAPIPPAETPVRSKPKSSQHLPSLNSAEWESEDLPPPPPRSTKKRK